TEWTTDGSMRHPVFLGMRTDKNPKQITREMPSLEKKKIQATSITRKSARRDEEKKLGKDDEVINVNKITLTITNRKKIYWPKEKITKGFMIDYYTSIAETILPYLKDRPQSMHRFPNGIEAEGFFQKDVDRNKIPEWLKTTEVFSESNS